MPSGIRQTLHSLPGHSPRPPPQAPRAHKSSSLSSQLGEETSTHRHAPRFQIIHYLGKVCDPGTKAGGKPSGISQGCPAATQHPSVRFRRQEAEATLRTNCRYAQRYFNTKSVRLSETPRLLGLPWNRRQKAVNTSRWKMPNLSNTHGFHVCIRQAVGCIQQALT